MASSIQKTPKFVLSDDTQKLLSENGLGRFISEVQDLCQIVKDVDEHPPPKPKELQQQLEALRDSLENTLRAIDNLSFQAYMKVMCNASARKINMVIWSAKGGSWPLALIGLIGLPDELAGFVSWMPLMIDAVNHNTTRILLILGGVLIALWPWPWRLRSDPPLINVPAWRQFWPTPWRGIGNTLGLVLAVTIIFLLASWFLPDSGWHPSVEKLEETIEEWATNPDHQSTKTLNDIDELTEFQFQLFVDDTIVIAELRKETPNVLRLVTNHPLADRVAGLLLQMPERDQLTFWNYIEREMLKLSPGYEFTNYKDQFGTLRIVPVQIVKKLPVSELTQEQFISSVERTAEYPRFAEKLIHEQLLNYHDGNS